MRLLGSQEVVLAQPTVIVWRGVSQWTQLGLLSVNEHSFQEHMAQDAHTPNWRKPFPSWSLSQIPGDFPDFFFKIPWVFPDWKIGISSSGVSLISRVAGNPAGARLQASPCSYGYSPVGWGYLDRARHLVQRGGGGRWVSGVRVGHRVHSVQGDWMHPQPHITGPAPLTQLWLTQTTWRHCIQPIVCVHLTRRPTCHPAWQATSGPTGV